TDTALVLNPEQVSIAQRRRPLVVAAVVPLPCGDGAVGEHASGLPRVTGQLLTAGDEVGDVGIRRPQALPPRRRVAAEEPLVEDTAVDDARARQSDVDQFGATNHPQRAPGGPAAMPAVTVVVGDEGPAEVGV